MKKLIYVVTFSLLLVSIVSIGEPALAEDLTSSSFIIRDPILSAGGGLATSSSFETGNVLGETTTGTSSSANFQGETGFSYIIDPMFSLSIPSSVSYGTINVSTVSQTLNTNISPIKVIDTRGTTLPWSLTMTSTNLAATGTPIELSGSNNTVTFSGNYTGVSATSTAALYTVEITTGGGVGTAVFKWTNPAGTLTQNITTSANVLLGDGITVNFGTATYVVGDKWIFPVDSIGYQSLTSTPNIPTVNYGDGNITIGASGAFTGAGITSDARTLLSSGLSGSQGSYTQVVDIRQIVHSNTLKGTFNATITLTLS